MGMAPARLRLTTSSQATQCPRTVRPAIVKTGRTPTCTWDTGQAMTTPLPLIFTAPRRGVPPVHLADLDSAARRDAVRTAGQPAFRADQLARHYFTGLTRDAAEMTDLPADGRAEFVDAVLPELLTEVRSLACDAGDTRKTLWKAHDGTLIESVLMRYPDRITLCVSSQAGCGMACPFCATGQGGLQRVLAAVKMITAPGPLGLGISARSVTVSTVGLVPAIERLTAEKLQVRLAVSLHTPDDELRDTLVPVNDRWKIDEVLRAARGYADTTGRRVSIEYALIRDINDQPWRADMLGKILKEHLGQLVHVNLIPLNPTPGSQWDASPKPVQDEFVRRVRAQGVACTVRDTRGQEIAAACGQLAAAEK